jgi:hypothetical protein
MENQNDEEKDYNNNNSVENIKIDIHIKVKHYLT